VELEGKFKEMCTVWQLRRNFISLMALLSICSFAFFSLNF